VEVLYYFLYVVTSVFICIRKVDGAGVVQTPEMRNITLIIWGVFGLIILIRLSNLAGKF
jgi:hypothetical protein